MEKLSQNPFKPGVSQAEFIPDQLIAGPLQLVTDTVEIAQGGVYKRGTVLGMVSNTRQYILCKKSATDGSQTPVCILIDDVDATQSSVKAGIYLMGEFNINRIIADENFSKDELKSKLRMCSIFLRDSVQS